MPARKGMGDNLVERQPEGDMRKPISDYMQRMLIVRIYLLHQSEG